MTARVTTHVLDGSDGTHAGGVGVRILLPATGEVLFEGATDAGGRLSVEIAPERLGSAAAFELVFDAGAHWAARHPGRAHPPVREIAFRIALPLPDGRCHLPVILSPHGCSAWWSG